MTVIASIDRTAFASNLKLIRNIVPNSRVMAVVKANAYGHGLVQSAFSIEADAFAVAHLAEAKVLRHAGVETPICLLSPNLTGKDLIIARDLQLDLVIHSEHGIEQLEKQVQNHPARLGDWRRRGPRQQWHGGCAVASPKFRDGRGLVHDTWDRSRGS